MYKGSVLCDSISICMSIPVLKSLTISKGKLEAINQRWTGIKKNMQK